MVKRRKIGGVEDALAELASRQRVPVAQDQDHRVANYGPWQRVRKQRATPILGLINGSRIQGSIIGKRPTIASRVRHAVDAALFFVQY